MILFKCLKIYIHTKMLKDMYKPKLFLCGKVIVDFSFLCACWYLNILYAIIMYCFMSSSSQTHLNSRGLVLVREALLWGVTGPWPCGQLSHIVFAMMPLRLYGRSQQCWSGQTIIWPTLHLKSVQNRICFWTVNDHCVWTRIVNVVIIGVNLKT